MDVFLLSIVISTNKTEAAVQDTNEGTLNVQWEDENFGESICNALKKEEVTYADIEGITGIITYIKVRRNMWKKEVAFQHTVIILLMNCVVQDSRIRIW